MEPTLGGASNESSLSISIGLAFGKKDAADTGDSYGIQALLLPSTPEGKKNNFVSHLLHRYWTLEKVDLVCLNTRRPLVLLQSGLDGTANRSLTLVVNGFTDEAVWLPVLRGARDGVVLRLQDAALAYDGQQGI